MNTILRRFSFQAMGSFCELQLFGNSRVEIKKQARALTAEVQRLEQKYSRFINTSKTAEINASAGLSLGVKVDQETQSLLDHARTCFMQSEGLFDVTSGALNQLWDFRTGVVPSRENINTALESVGFDKLEWRKNRITLPPGMSIDFGGIVKEYAADCLVRLAKEMGLQHGLINLGGDFSVIGPQPGGEPWPVGVAYPNDPERMMAKIDVTEGGIASSGDYARYFNLDGKNYSHIINPVTGWPSTGMRAVTVAANLCTVAGSIATIAMLKDEQDAINWLEQSGTPHLYMTQDEVIDGKGVRRDAADSDAQSTIKDQSVV